MRSWSRSKSLFFGGAFLAAIGSNLKGAENSAPTPVLPGTIEQRDLRMAWWREAKFGMFIHWGPFSVLAGRWKDKNYGDSVFIQRKAKISAGDYAAEGAQFGAGKFDPEAWARLAREAGMRYVVLTAKHHDGFAMWPTKVSEFNIRDHARVNRDPVGELAVACRAQGLKFGLYYSQARDWHHPGGALGGENVKSWDSSLNGDFRSYVEETAMPQVRELLSQYGTIDEFWWDTPNLMTSELAEKFQGLLALQPQIVTNNRLYGRDPRFGGDFETPEQYIPATIKSPMVSGAPGDFDGSVGAGKGASRDFEVCMTMNESWGFTADDHAWKSAENIIRKLVDIASKGGNFLLNIGPDADGRIPQESQDVLREIGGWMKVNGESIYGTTAGPFRYLPWGQATRKSGKLYLHVFDWPTNGKLWVPMIARVTKVCPLGEPEKELEFSSANEGVSVILPSGLFSPPSSVLVVDLEGEPRAIRQGLQSQGGIFRLPVEKAELEGLRFSLEDGALRKWIPNVSKAHWPIYVEKPGTYRVQAEYSCEAGKVGSRYLVRAGKIRLSAETKPTKSIDAFRSFAVGSFQVEESGTIEISLCVATRDAMNLRGLIVTLE